MSARVTIKDVARKANVSVATVSRVLNDNYSVRHDTKKKVHAASKQLGYVPNSIARSLKTQSTHTIGFVVSDISNTYHISIARSIEDIIQRHNYSIILCSTENNRERELTYLKLLLSKNVDGLILNCSGKNDDFIMEMNQKLPTLLLNRRLKSKGFRGDFIDGNNFFGCYSLTKHLLAMGHRKIYAVTGPRHLSNGLERFSGFVKAMEESGVIVDEQYPWCFEGSFTLESGIEAVRYMCAMPDKPTAILTQNNMTTIGLLKGMREKNIIAPEDISLAAYDGLDNLALLSTRPTVADFDTVAMGRKAGEAILERIQDNAIPNREFIFEPIIIPGNAIGVPTDNLQRRTF